MNADEYRPRSRYAEWALFAAAVAPQIAYTAVSPLTGTIAADYGVPSGAPIISVFLLGYALSMPLSGFIADAIGARRVLIIGLTGGGLAALVPLCAPGWAAMLVSRFLIGLLGCSSTVATRIYIQRSLPAARHVPALSLLAIGVAMCPYLAPLLGSGLGVTAGWRVLLGVLAAVLLAAAAMMVAAAPDPGHGEGVAGIHQILGSYRSALANRRFVTAALAIALVSMGYFAVLAHGAEALAARGIGAGAVGVLFAVAALGFVGGSTYLRRAGSRGRMASVVARAAAAGLAGAAIVAMAGIPAVPAAGTVALAAVGLAGVFAAAGVIIPATQVELVGIDLPRHAVASGLFFFIQLAGGAGYSMGLDAVGIATPVGLAVAVALPLAGILAVLRAARARGR